MNGTETRKTEEKQHQNQKLVLWKISKLDKPMRVCSPDSGEEARGSEVQGHP